MRSYANTHLSTVPLPSSYAPTVNMPGDMRHQNMVLLRNYLYPKFAPVVARAVASRERFAPFAILTNSFGPFSRPAGGIQAVSQSRDRLLQLRRAAALSEGGPDLRKYLIPQAVAHGPTVGRRPGLGLHNVPFRHHSGLPPHAQQRRRVLADEWWRYATPTAMRTVNQVMPEVMKAKRNATFYIDPFVPRR